MLDDDDGEELQDSPQRPCGRRGLDRNRRDGDAAGRVKREEISAVPCRMLAEHLAAESERSLAGGRGRAMVATGSGALARPCQSARIPCHSGTSSGRAVSMAAEPEPADPQLPCAAAAALSALWCSAGAGDGAGVARALRRISASHAGHKRETAVDVGDAADGGSTALIKAARAGSVECVVHLLKAGAHVGRRNANGETALHAAASQGHVRVIDALVTAGVSCPWAQEIGCVPLADRLCPSAS